MSETLGIEQQNVASVGLQLPPGLLRQEAPARLDVQPAELRLRQLIGAWEIAEVADLRRQIQLPPGVLADPGFAELEKKETGSAWSLRFSGATPRWVH